MGIKEPERAVLPSGFPWFPVLFLLLMLAAGVLAWEFVVGPVAVGDGGYDLTVTFAASPSVVKAVHCQPFMRQDVAVWAMNDPKSAEFQNWIVADPLLGKTIPVPIQTSIKMSPFGREFDRVQATHLVVIADLQDGTHVKKLITIPDCRVSRSVTVTLP
jgi:hypothetical protein